MNLKTLLLTLLIGLNAAAAAEIKFLPLRAAKPGTDGEYYTQRPDPARVEYTLPLSLEDRSQVTAAQLKSYNQEQLDQLYFRLGSGPIPTGDFKGTVLVKNSLVQSIEGKLLENVLNQGVFHGVVRKAAMKLLCQSQDGLECIGEYLWKGKHFYPPQQDGTVELRNAVPLAIRNSVLLKAAGLGAFVAPLQKARVESFGGANHMMLFPANVYCGQSLVDGRHESIIIDAAYGDDFTPYIPEVDGISGRDGKNIRDEIRMIRPGLYLGRAYADKIFLLNFVLESVQPPAADWSNKCWGTRSWQ